MAEIKKVIGPQHTYNEMAIKLEEDIATPSSAKRFFDDLPESKEDVSPSKKREEECFTNQGNTKKSPGIASFIGGSK